jgi:hypothetical protein
MIKATVTVNFEKNFIATATRTDFRRNPLPRSTLSLSHFCQLVCSLSLLIVNHLTSFEGFDKQERDSRKNVSHETDTLYPNPFMG